MKVNKTVLCGALYEVDLKSGLIIDGTGMGGKNWVKKKRHRGYLHC